MSIEELLNKRYKVIADYPNSPFKKEQVIEFKEIYPHSGLSYQFRHDEPIFAPEYFDKYPNLFRPLQWWEGRAVEDMPKYVRYDMPRHPDLNRPHKVLEYLPDQWITLEIGAFPLVAEVIPITEQEYLTYKNQTK